MLPGWVGVGLVVVVPLFEVPLIVGKVVGAGGFEEVLLVWAVGDSGASEDGRPT